MACDQHGDDINPYDLLHVAAVRKGTRYPPPPELHSTTDLLAPLAADNARLRQDCEELEQQVVELVARILALEADRDHWRNMVNDLEHNSIYLDSIAFYEGRHAEVTARIAELEAAIDALTLSGADCYALVLELEEREEKYRIRITELETALSREAQR